MVHKHNLVFVYHCVFVFVFVFGTIAVKCAVAGSFVTTGV
jgi:hypothetical protein